MFCDGCGTPFAAGTSYCSSCGKQLTSAPAAPVAGGAAAPMPARAAGDGRVRRNLSLLAGLWMASGVLQLMGLGWLMIFRRMMFGSDWPLGNWGPSLRPFLLGGLLSGGIFLALFGVVHLLLAWGLFERQPWARMLGIVLAFLALIRIPFGTALGIYTLWVLLPESSGQEYDGLAGVGGQANSARNPV